MEKLKLKRDLKLEKIKSMNITELMSEMEQDAEKGLEPFNSVAYRELTRQRKNAGESFFQEIANRKDVSYISLLALREIDVERYKKLNQEMTLFL